jgi:uncharacterized protein (TIGR00251 family)
VRLQPRAARDEIAGERAGAALVRVTEPPLEGRANAALVKLIARRAGVAKSRVSIVRGARSRQKLVLVEGMGEAELRCALGLDEGP